MSPTLKCPRCAADMIEVRIHDIPIDRCPTCGGILLDRGETEAIDELGLGGAIEGGAERAAGGSTGGPPAHCYACDRPMIALTGAGEIEFDWCDRCERIFFDRGELAAFDAAEP